MKTILLSLLLSVPAFAAHVNSAKLDRSRDKILVSVTYGGGCKVHDFTLKLSGCRESFPVQCDAQLIETTLRPDLCEAMITETIEFDLRDYDLDDPYYSGASLTIYGDQNFNGKISSATITLPFLNGMGKGILKRFPGNPSPL